MRVVVATLLLFPVLAGCSSGAPPADARFMDAQVRFSGAADNETVDHHTLAVPSGADVLLERHAFETGGAWAYRILDPEGDTMRNSGLFDPPPDFPGRQAGWFEEIKFRDPSAGDHTVEVGCTKSCSYTAAFDFNGTVSPFPAEQMHDGSDAHFQGSAPSGLDEAHTFTVPGGTKAIVAQAAWWSDGEFFMMLRDAEGARRTNIDGEVTSRGDIRYSPTGGLEGIVPGTWELDVECEGSCRYSYAVEFIG